MSKHVRLWLLIVGLLIVGFLYPDNQVTSTGLGEELVTHAMPMLGQIADLPSVRATAGSPNLETFSAILVDGDSGSILYADQPRTLVPIASTTKLMTAVLVRRHLELDTLIEVTPADVAIIGSDMQLRAGERISVRGLLTGLLVASGNDAAITLARVVGGTPGQFVELMNQEARRVGLKDTHFSDPAGLDDTGRSSAFDLSIMARMALQDQVIAEIVRTPSVTVSSSDGRIRHELINSNRLVGEYQYLGAIGLKTGFTPEAGHCLVAAAERDGHRLIAVILRTHEDTITASAIEARKLLDWGWRSVIWQN